MGDRAHPWFHCGCNSRPNVKTRPTTNLPLCKQPLLLPSHLALLFPPFFSPSLLPFLPPSLPSSLSPSLPPSLTLLPLTSPLPSILHFTLTQNEHLQYAGFCVAWLCCVHSVDIQHSQRDCQPPASVWNCDAAVGWHLGHHFTSLGQQHWRCVCVCVGIILYTRKPPIMDSLRYGQHLYNG